MLLKTYEEKNLLCNMSVNGATSQTDTYGYRGDLVLAEGEIADDAGRRLPPTAVVKQATVLVKGDKISMISGIIAGNISCCASWLVVAIEPTVANNVE